MRDFEYAMQELKVRHETNRLSHFPDPSRNSKRNSILRFFSFNPLLNQSISPRNCHLRKGIEKNKKGNFDSQGNNKDSPRNIAV